MTRALVVGFGSIGARHAAVLAEMGVDVAVASRRPVQGFPGYASLDAGLDGHSPDYVVIANETSAHAASLDELARSGFAGMVLVEKPLAVAPLALPAHRFARAAIAYNLRFHPVIGALASALAGETVLGAQVYCGQYLPTWRPQADYRQSYSARPELGGGVLRDLSHELDYVLWLLGPWRRLAALGGRFSSLEIASDDSQALLLELERCPLATVQVNYLDRVGRRDILINTDRHTIRADLVAGALSIDREVHAFTVERNDTYRAQHQAMLTGDDDRLCRLDEGLAVMNLIDAAEQASKTGEWVKA
jgi:predicted dehydrogenase